MGKLEWMKLADFLGRVDAEFIKSFLDAHDIDTEIIQEAYEQFTYGGPLGSAQIFVPDYQFDRARELLRESGWHGNLNEEEDDLAEDED